MVRQELVRGERQTRAARAVVREVCALPGAHCFLYQSICVGDQGTGRKRSQKGEGTGTGLPVCVNQPVASSTRKTTALLLS